MLSAIGAVRRLVARRVTANRLILAAVVVTILLATALLAAGPIYADAVTLASLQRTLDDAPIREANVEVTVFGQPNDYLELDEIATTAIADTFETTGGTIVRRAVSGSYELPGQLSDEKIDITEFQQVQLIEDHTSLVDGRWPARTQNVYETALPEPAAEQLGLSVGDRLTLTDRREGSRQVVAEIAGIYRVDDPTAVYWYEEELAVDGFMEGESFNTHGPLVVDLGTLFDVSPSSAEFNWRVFPNFDRLEVADVTSLRVRVQDLQARLNAALESFAGSRVTAAFNVETDLPAILGASEESLVVTRSGVLMLTVQLAMLAGYALVLTAGLLVDSRRRETGLLRARGASNGQILSMAMLEGVMLTVPAAIAAPWVASAFLRLLNTLGPLARIDLTLMPTVTADAYLLSFLAAAACIAVLAVPAVRSAGTFNDSFVSSGREQNRSAIQRTGVDVALLALAGLAYWQLQTHGAQVTSTVKGLLGIDPLLVAAPAIGLLAGAVLALRTVPLLARAAERIVATRRSAVAAFPAWQVARRPARYARSSLLLMMAIAIGFFAAAYSITWSQSQEDQADYQIGSDVRVSPDRRPGAISDIYLEDAHRQITGIEQSMPVVRVSRRVARSGEVGRFVLLDSEEAGDVIRVRDDLSPRPFPEMMSLLANRRPSFSGIGLPGEPERLGIVMSGSQDQSSIGPFTVSVVIQDGSGLLHRVTLGDLNATTDPARIEARLTAQSSSGTTLKPDYPLAIVDVEIVSRVPAEAAPDTIVGLTRIEVSEESTGAWEEVPIELHASAWEVGYSTDSELFTVPSVSLVQGSSVDSVQLLLNPGNGPEGSTPISAAVHYSLRPKGTNLPDLLPIIVTTPLLEATGSEVGDELPLSSLGTGEIVGAIDGFPTHEPDAGVILADLPTIQMMTYEVGGIIQQVDERWISVDDGGTTRVSAELRLAPYESFRVADRVGRANALKSDPIALGTIGSLSLGFVAAALFAAIGFTVSATVSARERVTEFALIRAIGLSPNELGFWLTFELGALVFTSLALGTLIGVLLSALALPLISITQGGASAFPDVIVVYPWSAVVWLEVGVVVVLGAIVATLAVLLTRVGIGPVLRLGDEG